ncbi:serine/threonine protein kinase SRPK1, partial [Trifolium medium]|nr:serine/threonine protein kinase SRPK1 [Trifolium medium]
MKDDENIETIFSRFQNLVSGLQVLNKSYTTANHVKKILKSLPTKWRPKVTAIQEAKDVNKPSLEYLTGSFQSHELELIEDEPVKKFKSFALNSIGKSSNTLQVVEEETHGEGSDDGSEVEEMTLISKRFQYLTNKKKRFGSNDF